MQKPDPEELIARFLCNEATTDEQLALHEWVSASSTNQQIFQEYVELWNINHKNLPAFDASAAYYRLKHRIDRDEKKNNQPTYWYKMAASLILASLLGVLGYWFVSTNSVADVKWQERLTRSGQKLSIQLTDGTQVTLNTNSHLKWPEHFDESREVYLTGEAFFEVTKDPLRPFVVHTKGIETKVLGTSFNVQETGEQLAVTVVTGKVQVANNIFSELLVQHQKLTYQLLSQKWKREATDFENELAWKKNTLILNNERLDEAALRLEKWFGVQITFKNNTIKNCRITGKFKNETLEHILNAMSDATGIHYVIANQKVTLSGEGCN